MLRQKIQISTANKDANINIHFQSSNNLSGLDEAIDNLVTDQTTANINDTSDEENVRFMPVTTYTLSVRFLQTFSYVTHVAPHEFLSSTADTTVAFQSSFYAYKIFDSPIENTQNLLYSGYLNGYDFNGSQNSNYSWNSSFEYSDIHVSNWYLNSITANTFSLYMKLNFYSGNSGKVYPFTSGLTLTNSETTLYNVLTFNKSSNMYSVSLPFTFTEITNADYVNLVNDSVDSVNIIKPVVPSGNTFTITGQYITA